MTRNPKLISINRILYLFDMGSRMAVQSDAVANPTKLTDAVEICPEAKKAIQWAPTNNPVEMSLMKSLKGTSSFPLVSRINATIPIVARRVLKKTISTAGIEISFPKIAVDPQSKTMK